VLEVGLELEVGLGHALKDEYIFSMVFRIAGLYTNQ
jgi:hypothetical protein